MTNLGTERCLDLAELEYGLKHLYSIKKADFKRDANVKGKHYKLHSDSFQIFTSLNNHLTHE